MFSLRCVRRLNGLKSRSLRHISVGTDGDSAVATPPSLTKMRQDMAMSSFFKVLGHFEREKGKAVCNKVYLASYIDTASIFYNRVPETVWRQSMTSFEQPKLAALKQYYVDIVEYRTDEHGTAEELKLRIHHMISIIKRDDKVNYVSHEYHSNKAYRTLFNIPTDQLSPADDSMVFDVLVHKWHHWKGSNVGAEADKADLEWFKQTFPLSKELAEDLDKTYEGRFDGVPFELGAQLV